VEPAVAEVVDVLQHGAIGAQDLAELSLFLVGERRRQVPAAVPDGRLPPLAAAPVLEPMQVIAFPAERRLDDVVQEPKACRRRDLDPPPQRRRCSLQADLQLMNRRAEGTWHRATLAVRNGPIGATGAPGGAGSSAKASTARLTVIIRSWSAMKRTKVACAISDQMILTGSRRTPQP